ncbi:hypothetical protein [Psychrobacillus soli]|uniref:hypothetical protein n=1 Tax=Psychrobacillus soli TaxID=1543965 RepID=UPI00163C0BEB|nr:hypothetical protein [Psychrobacillus soli]
MERRYEQKMVEQDNIHLEGDNKPAGHVNTYYERDKPVWQVLASEFDGHFMTHYSYNT